MDALQTQTEKTRAVSLQDRCDTVCFLIDLVLTLDGPESLYGEALDIARCILGARPWVAPDPEDSHPSQVVDLLIDREVGDDHLIWVFLLPGDA